MEDHGDCISTVAVEKATWRDKISEKTREGTGEDIIENIIRNRRLKLMRQIVRKGKDRSDELDP